MVKTIGIVNAYNETAGPVTVLKTFLKNFDVPGYNIVVFIPKGNQNLQFEGANIKIVHTATAPLDKDIFSIKAILYFFKSVVTGIKFAYYLKKYKINILHNNSSNLIVQSVAAWFCKVPVIYHVREIWNTRNRFSRILYSFICRISSKIICITDTVRKMNFSKQQQARYHKKFVTVYDCADDAFFRNALLPKKNDEITITYMGRLAPIKGLDVLLEAFAIIDKKIASPVRLKIVGDLPKQNQFYHSYRSMVHQLAMNCKNDFLSIDFLGFRNDVWQILAGSHLLILPSRIEEGLGLVLAEAALANNYLITTNFGGQKEIIELLRCGDLFENENAIDLAMKIENFINSRSQYETCIARARTIASQLFSPHTYKNNVLAIYESLCSVC